MMRVLMGLLLLLFGAALAFGGGRTVFRSRASESWPTVQGTVVSSNVETVRSKRSVRYHPEVHYRYDVAGQSFTADTISFSGNDSGAIQDAQHFTRKYAAGTPVTLHYEPADPSVACIECGSAGVSSYVVMLGGLALALVAGAGLVDMRRSGGKDLKRARAQSVARPAR